MDLDDQQAIPKFLIHDRAIAERWVQTVRAECLDWTLVLGCRHLERPLRTYVEHCNRPRPRCGLGLGLPEPPPREPVPAHSDEVWRRDLLAGLINQYRRIAA